MSPRYPYKFSLFFVAVALLLPSCSKEVQAPAIDEHKLGIEAYKSGRYHDAVNHFEKALITELDNIETCLMLAIIYDDCLNSPYLDKRKQDKTKAIEYYEKYISRAGDSSKAVRAKEWLDVCRQELAAMDSGVPQENLNADDIIEKQKAIENLETAVAEIARKYVTRLDTVHRLESEINELKSANRELNEKIASVEPAKKSISPLSWVLLIVLIVVIIALAWSLRTTPRIVPQERVEPPMPEKELIPPEKILGSYIWVESVHNRGVMAISRDEQGYFVETRAINTSAVSSGHGKYEDNVLEATLSDESGEGALMTFEFYEGGRAFVASWEDELGHGSAVGLRNEFDEMVKPESAEKKRNV